MQEGLLNGYRALDLANEKGVYCTKVLADLGTQVTLVEHHVWVIRRDAVDHFITIRFTPK